MRKSLVDLMGIQFKINYKRCLHGRSNNITDSDRNFLVFKLVLMGMRMRKSLVDLMGIQFKINYKRSSHGEK